MTDSTNATETCKPYINQVNSLWRAVIPLATVAAILLVGVVVMVLQAREIRSRQAKQVLVPHPQSQNDKEQEDAEERYRKQHIDAEVRRKEMAKKQRELRLVKVIDQLRKAVEEKKSSRNLRAILEVANVMQQEADLDRAANDLIAERERIRGKLKDRLSQVRFII